jgi:hypothetical protein
MQMIRLVQSTCFNRFQAIKHEIESELTIFKFPGQSVKDMVSAFILKEKVLENFGMYEHRLMLVMLDRFLEGGGTSDDVPTQMYRHHLFDLRITLDKALMSVSSLDKTAKTTHMIAKGLTCCQVCTTAEEHWKIISDDNRWAPAKVEGDRKRPQLLSEPILHTFDRSDSPGLDPTVPRPPLQEYQRSRRQWRSSKLELP